MIVDLIAPGDRYRVRLEATWTRGGLRANRGIRLGDLSIHRFMVMLGHACAVELLLGENGLTVERVVMMEADEATITAIVTTASGSPDWLPTEGAYLIFQGDRQAACQVGQRYLPLDGMVLERSWTDEDSLPLDSLAIAVGQAVARANQRLASICGVMGGALVQRVLIRVEVEQTSLSRGRMLVKLPPAGGGGTGSQFVELTVQASPDGGNDGLAEEEGG